MVYSKLKKFFLRMVIKFLQPILLNGTVVVMLKNAIDTMNYRAKGELWSKNLTSRSKFFSMEASVLNHSGLPQNIVVDENAFVRGHLRVLKYGGKVLIGKNVYVGSGSQIWSGEEVLVGDGTLIGDNVFISDTDSHEMDPYERIATHKKMLIDGLVNAKGSIVTRKVIIEENVWIGHGCIILKGVTIGKAAIIGAGSVVTKDCRPGAIYAGNPARLIKILDEK